METLYLMILLLGFALTAIGLRSISKQPKHRILFHVANCFGPILFLRVGWRRILLISSADAAKDLFTENDEVFANRPEIVPAVVFGCKSTNLAWAPHGDGWSRLRDICCHEVLPFHCRLDQHDSLADEVKQLIHQLYSNKDSVLELRPMFLELVFNVMMRMFAGKRYCQKKPTEEEGEENEYIWLREYVNQSFKMTTGETDWAYFFPILKSLGLTDLEQRCVKLQTNGDLLMKRIINEVRNSPDGSCQKEGNAIQFLLGKQKQDCKQYSDSIISAMVLVLLTAGVNTTTGILEWAFALLLNHPEVLQKAQDEIDKHAGSKCFLEQSDITHLPYLRCIVKETMRMYPAAPFLVPHQSSDDCKVRGYAVPKDTLLMVNAWAIHNDPNTWKEPEKFNPERFKGNSDEHDEFKFMTFGYGKRSCPGKDMAVRVISMALGSLIHCFNWEKVAKVDMTEQTGLALLKDKPLTAVCRPRIDMR
ncbi:cytochrome P450 81F1-like [Bidens hawaiensis]|uniref:cytochrome P450 81F1-like n=1 Tax=Bidens hawaiensis TaxID=980011 RepID=UPI004048EBA8